MNTKKKITVSAISQAAGVSPATVSRVLNHRELVQADTIQKVEAAMELLGFTTPVSNSAAPKGQPLLIINVPDLTNVFYMEVIRGAFTSAKAHGCHLLINHSPLNYGSLDDFFRLLSSTKASGLILLNQVSTDILVKLDQMIPVVQCCEYNPETDIPYVSIDDCKAAETAVNYLISLGHSKVALLNGPFSFRYAQDRKRGFQNAMERAGVHVPQSWMIHLPEIDYGMAYSAACQLLSSEVKPNGIFAISDIYAAAVIRAARKYNYRVPEDISVVGFDNTDISLMSTPSITTISQPRFQEGFCACEMLIEKMSNPLFVSRPLLLETELIVRESS